MQGTGSPAGLVGRKHEIEILAKMIDGAKRGRSATLVVRGEPGIGKTMLAEHVLSGATGVQVLRAAGVESEMELPFSTLHQLCGPIMDGIEELPEPQRNALRTVFGRTSGDPPDRFLVGLGMLSLVAGTGAERPLLCFIDDAQWLDHASGQILAFVARRLLADPVFLLFGSRTTPQFLSPFAELVVAGLADHDARALLESVIPFVLDEDIRARLIDEAGGNPLALVELPRGLSPAQLAGGFVVPATLHVSERIEETFRRRLDRLTPESRQLMLLAAAEPVGDAAVVLGAARALGIGPHAAAAAEADGLLNIGERVRLRHPLVRSTAYRAAAFADRADVHRALAEATDAETDPDRRAWHLAQATTGPDDELAAELERSASRAQARGGYAAAAAFLHRAAVLTTDSTSRARRDLAAAQTKHLAGAHGEALDLLAAAESGPLDEGQRAAADLLRAEIAYTERRGNDAPELLVRAARRFESVDPLTARNTYLDAVLAAHFAGRLAHDTIMQDVASASRRSPSTGQTPTAADLLLDGLATAITDGYAAGAPILREAVVAFRGPDVSLEEELRWLWPAAHVAMALWDDESYELLAARHIELGRESGLLAVQPTALTTRIVSLAFAGQLTAADELIGELQLLTDAMQIPLPSYGPLFVAGWRGREAALAEVRRAAVSDAEDRGEGAVLAFADYADAVLRNGQGQYDVALTAAESIGDLKAEGFVIYTAGLVELIEAASRTGALDRAANAFDLLSEATLASGTDWALGMRARSLALLSSDSDAEDLYREAIELLSPTRIRPQIARSQLLYGEWLRRRGRNVDARDQLRSAYENLAGMGIEAFADRARRELLAAGETVRKRSVETHTQLTAQEAHICRLAVDGHTNREIGANLFISARTVEWHLRKVFTKLGISSRLELEAALANLGHREVIG